MTPNTIKSVAKLADDNQKLQDRLIGQQVVLNHYRDALALIASYGEYHAGCCPFGCDTPTIADKALGLSLKDTQDLESMQQVYGLALMAFDPREHYETQEVGLQSLKLCVEQILEAKRA